MNGYTFSILPSARELIKQLIPNAHPAINIFVGYEIKSGFDSHYDKLERYIYPALLGIDKDSDLGKFDEIEFIDSQTKKTLHKVTPHDEKV